MTFSRRLELPILIVLVGAAIYEAAVALQWIPLGTVPGDGARFEGVVIASALAAMLAGIILSLVLAAQGRGSARVAFFAVAAAALMVARFYTFDPYDLPTLIRYSETGSFSPAWVYSIVLAGLAASVLCLVRPRVGFVLAAPVLLLCAFTVSFFGFGH